MKTNHFIWPLVMALVLCACEHEVSPIDNPSGTDTVISPSVDTVIPPIDTIVPPDTVSAPEILILSIDTIIIGTSDEPGEFSCYMPGANGKYFTGPYAYLTIVKFFNPEQENQVIVQHPVKGYKDGIYEYYDNDGLYLDVLPPQYTHNTGCGVNPDLVKWADAEMHISGTSPYIPLADGYCLIDWKWHQIFPLSALTEVNKHMYEHVRDHVFISDLKWEDINDLTVELDASHDVKPLRGVAIIRVWAKEMACVSGYRDSPFLTYNLSLYYWEGMCYDNAYQYYKNRDTKGDAYLDYIHLCDSLQAVYQQKLIEFINDGQILKLAF